MRTGALLLLLLVARIGIACEFNCKTPNVKAALEHEDIVFKGTISALGDSSITFAVQRVWKGTVPAVFTMPKVVNTAPCSPGFFEKQLSVGNELIVYAHWWAPDARVARSLAPAGSLPGYVVSLCSRTGLSREASEDFRRLGPGRTPQQ